MPRFVPDQIHLSKRHTNRVGWAAVSPMLSLRTYAIRAAGIRSRMLESFSSRYAFLRSLLLAPFMARLRSTDLQVF